MAEQYYTMSWTQVAEIMGTVGSPLIVVSELLKNAVDASAKNIDIYYNRDENTIIVNNDYKGFTFEEIKNLSHPGISQKKQATNLINEQGMFLTGSKGLGLLSVFLLCERAEIFTAPKDEKVYRIILDKKSGAVEQTLTTQTSESAFTKVILNNVDEEIIDFLSSESEIRKLRHICTYLYKNKQVPFPKMRLHISGQPEQNIVFDCDFPPMLYDVHFSFSKEEQTLHFCCISPDKPICQDEVIFDNFKLQELQNVMLTKYGIKDTIPTRSNELIFSDFSEVPNFEGRVIVYEKNLAGAKLKEYGAGVNIYVNEFALYNYLAEENDWLGLADYSMRKKVTRLKPHNVFGYVDFPRFNENEEKLKISNERADFIQDLTFSKLMYLLKGVVMFAIFSIDVADKNPKYKVVPSQEQSSGKNEDQGQSLDEDTATQSEDDDSEDSETNSLPPADDETPSNGSGPYSPSGAYKPKKNIQKSLFFTEEEGLVIDGLKGVDDLGNKIYNMVYELSKLDLQIHRYSIAYLFRALLESATKYLSNRQSKVVYYEDSLSTSVISALNYFGNLIGKGKPLAGRKKSFDLWQDAVKKRNLVNILNEYIHNENPVDALLLQETWNTMKGYIITCLTIE